MKDASQPSEAPSFWSLPPEIRCYIYRLLLTEMSHGMLRFKKQNPSVVDLRSHTYPTFRQLRPQTPAEGVWQETVTQSNIFSNIHTLVEPWDPQSTTSQEARSDHEIEVADEERRADPRLIFLLSSKKMYNEAMREYHSLVELRCEFPEQLHDLIDRVQSCGTASIVHSLNLDLLLFDSSAVVFGQHGIENGAADMASWRKMLDDLRPEGIQRAFPNLRLLSLRFIQGFWPGQHVDAMHPSEFDAFLRDSFAPKFTQLGDVSVRVGGLQSHGLKEWIKEGVMGVWDLKSTSQEISARIYPVGVMQRFWC